jgi:serine phosphatase RsbU (regulator of sigma subunit)
MTRLTEPSSAAARHEAAAPRAIALASAVAVAFYAVAGLVEAALIHLFEPTRLELDWISDVVLSTALGITVYLWLHLRATRQALTEREREQVVIQTQLSLAEAMQRRLLPPVPAPTDGLEWAAGLTPAGRIGGDFFDFVEPTAGTRLMLIADVAGKGISAAMALTLLRSAFRNVARDTPSPAALATRLSAAFHDEWHGRPYVTGVIARVDARRRTLTYVNAGHPPGLLVRGDALRGLGEGGPPLGLLRSADYLEEIVSLQEGDVCAFVTDGISEAFDDTSQPWRVVAQAAARVRPLSAEAICSRIVSHARQGHGPEGVEDWTDDRTVIVLAVHDSREGPAAPQPHQTGDPSTNVSRAPR